MTTIDFTVNFKGTPIPFTAWPTSSTVGQVKSKLADETNITNDFQKLMYKGKLLQDDEQTLAIIPTKAKLILMGTPASQVQAIQNQDKKIANLRQQRQSIHRPYQQPRSVRDVKYTFHHISVLAEFQQQDKARQLLERLRDDRGIRAIMAARQWSVNELIELSPAEASILGYNRNAGQLIAIRLRTDDLTGFRHYDSIRKVLLHELTHNVWGDHDENFHKLNRQLNKDVVALDWTAHGGHQISSSGAYYQPDDQVDQGGTTTYETGSYRLGGGTLGGGEGVPSSTLRREHAAQAALSRLTKQEEQEMDEGCGS
ncbi:WLM domain-containing protein [Chlamydoabsidia padenii]|nr:WLM domain-containing protein [Chlamydoabsidia padenii]